MSSKYTVRDKVPGNLKHAIHAKPENDTDDGTDYIETERGSSQIGVPNGPGVVVPLETSKGGILGDRYSVYGKIIMGASVTRKGAIPLVMNSFIVKNAPSIFDDENQEIVMPPAIPQKMQKEAVMPATAKSNPTSASVSASPQPAGIVSAPTAPRVRVVMSGSFGRYSGNYVASEENNDQMILVSSLEDANFVPPVSDDPLTLRIADHSFTVVFDGIAFPLELFGVEVTVFRKHPLAKEIDGVLTT
jgi:hypothetical protein